MNKRIGLPGACNWCIDGDTGWFVAYSKNVLCKYDIQKKELFTVSVIPAKAAGGFQNPHCIKSGDLIYCIPYYESSIWCYDLNSNQWKEINLCNDKDVMACLLGEHEEVYYFFSVNLRKVFGLDLKAGNVVASYDVEVKEEIDIYYFAGVLVEDCVYLVLGGSLIYEFNLETLNQKNYELPNINDILYKIDFENNCFWLIGKKRKVYILNRENNTLNILTDFPENFMLYDFEKKLEITDWKNIEKNLSAFCDIYCLNGKVWLIPQSGSKMLYYDQSDGKIKVFDIQDEEETIETLDLSYRHIAAKFFKLYVRENRYLGIYSYRNKRILEIDTLNMTYENMDFLVNHCSLLQIEIQNFYENDDEFAYLIYNAKMEKTNVLLKKMDVESVGKRIYIEVSK